MASVNHARILGIILFLTSGLMPVRANAQSIEVKDISFLDESHGWVLASEPSPAILRTGDGGRTWTKTALPEDNQFWRIEFFDLHTGIAIYSSDSAYSLYRTADSGETWTKVSADMTGSGNDSLDLTLSYPNNATVSTKEAKEGYVAQLLEGGLTVRVYSDSPANAQSSSWGYFGDAAGQIWIAGTGFILHSVDLGKTWERQVIKDDPPIVRSLSGVALPGGQIWIDRGLEWDLERSIDNGKTWDSSLSMQDEGNLNFESLSFYNKRQGCAVADTQFIYCTGDSGLTWSRTVAFPGYKNGAPFRSKILLFGSSHGWATIGGGLFKTEDGGGSFTEVLTATNPAQSVVPGELGALENSINGPFSIAYGKDGFLYIVESEEGRLLRLDLKRKSIRVLIPSAIDRTSNDLSLARIAADSGPNIFIAPFVGRRLLKLDTTTGEVRTLDAYTQSLPEEIYPGAMTADNFGNLFIAAGTIWRWRIDAETLQAEKGLGTGFAADGITFDRGGNMFISNRGGCIIQRIDSRTKDTTTVAGTGECRSSGDGGPAIKATLNCPESIVTDGKGNLYFIDAHRVRRIDQFGIITDYAGSEEYKGYGGDGGPADKALLNNPSGLAVDPAGNLYIAEFVGNRIRRVDAVTHVITTVAGNGKPHRMENEM
jgi:photosystem II stability/assembly factor-like uncharacterized protein/sugar lactone lactonase YvrE